MGNLLSIVVHAANIHDTKSGIDPAKKAFEKYPTIKKFCGDEGYRKSFEENVLSELGLGVDISEKIVPGWAVIPRAVSLIVAGIKAFENLHGKPLAKTIFYFFASYNL